MGYLESSKVYFKYIKNIAKFPEVVTRVDLNGCLIREVDGMHSWSFYRQYKVAKVKPRWRGANDTP